MLRLLQRAGDGAGAAGILDVFLPLRDVEQGLRHLALRAPQIDLEHQGVVAGMPAQHLRQGRVRHQAAVPVELAVDFHRREARRQRARGHDVLGTQAHFGAVEHHLVARAYIHRAHADAGLAAVEPVEVDQPREGFAQRRGVIKAGLPRMLAARRPAWQEKPALALQHGAQTLQRGELGLQRLGYPAQRGAMLPGQGGQQRLLRHRFPEGQQRGGAFTGRVARDQCRIDRADGNTGHPGWMHAAVFECLHHTTLISAERAAALEHQGHAVVLPHLFQHGFGAARRSRLPSTTGRGRGRHRDLRSCTSRGWRRWTDR